MKTIYYIKTTKKEFDNANEKIIFKYDEGLIHIKGDEASFYTTEQQYTIDKNALNRAKL